MYLLRCMYRLYLENVENTRIVITALGCSCTSVYKTLYGFSCILYGELSILYGELSLCQDLEGFPVGYNDVTFESAIFAKALDWINLHVMNSQHSFSLF